MKLIQANKDKSIQIKEIDQGHYHVEHLRIVRDITGKHPDHQKRIQIYDKKDYDRTFGKGGFVEKHGLGAMNDDEVRVVHDPRLDDEQEQKRNDAEAERVRKEAAAAIKAEKAIEKAEKEAAQKVKADRIAAEKEADKKLKSEDKEIQDHLKAEKEAKAEAEKTADAKADLK